MGFHGQAAAHKPKITVCNAKHRLAWCQAHRHWTLEQWKRILWSDESRFTIWQSDGCQEKDLKEKRKQTELEELRRRLEEDEMVERRVQQLQDEAQQAQNVERRALKERES